jgi:hypothetical protein
MALTFSSPNSFPLKASFAATERTREYLDFDPCEHPLGVQLFGADCRPHGGGG